MDTKERQKSIAHKWRRGGRCRLPIDRAGLRCERCLWLLRGRRGRRRPGPARVHKDAAAAKRSQRAAKRARGECWRCPAQAEPGRTRCRLHLDEAAGQQAVREARHRES